MKYLVLMISCFSLMNCQAQTSLNIDLKKELEDILLKDQIYREFIDSETSEERKNEIARITNLSRENLQQSAWTLINKIDAENIIKVEKIISEFGYPGKSLVGEPANTAVFYVVQHSDKIQKYYPLIEEAGKKGELPFKYVGMMLDRKLTNEQKPQVYGTQLAFRMITNHKTGKQENFTYVLPIEDSKNVNKRRREAGFETTVEENARRFGIEYKEYSYEELAIIK